MLYFDNCDVVINNSGILAENASVDLSNNLVPQYVLGKKGIIGQSANGSIRAAFNLSYNIELDNEPTYNVSNTIKSILNDLSYSGVTISVGGITGYNCFLQSYSFKASPNELIKANASYVTFFPVSGDFAKKSGNVDYNKNNSLAHGWMTFIVTTGNFKRFPTFDFDYDFNADWEPIYLVGKQYPVQVQLLGIAEKMDFVRDIFTNVHFSGIVATDEFIDAENGDTEIDVMNIAFLCAPEYASGIFQVGEHCKGLSFSVSGCKIKNSQVGISVDNFLKVSTQIIKYT